MYRLGVVRKLAAPRRALENKNITPLGVVVVLSAFEPRGGSGNFRQNQERLDRLQNLCAVKDGQRRDVTGDIEVDGEFLGAALAHHALTQLGPPARGGSDLDFGEFLLKSIAEYRLERLGHVNRYCALFLRGFDGILPIQLPRRFGFGSVNRFDRKEAEAADQSRDHPKYSENSVRHPQSSAV